MANKLKFTTDGLHTVAPTLTGEVLIKMSVTWDEKGNKKYIWIAYGPNQDFGGERFNSEFSAKVYLNKYYGLLAA